jgi:hypothetical protein
MTDALFPDPTETKAKAKPPKKEPKATEAELLQLLDRKHAKQGNGGSGEYAFLTHVRNDGGFSATRTFDGVAVSLWPSRGYAIDVFEVKVSRSDWMRELKDPAKSEAAWEIGDRFWICATAGVVDPTELPHGWGLIEAYGAKVTDAGLTGRKLRTVVQAEWHGKPVRESAKGTIPKGLMVSMLRRAGAVPDHQTPAERLISDAEERGRAAERQVMQGIVDRAQERERETAQFMRAFSNASGISLNGQTTESLTQIGNKVRAILADDGHAERVQARLAQLAADLRRQAEQIDGVIKRVHS